ncbi:sensor histidine kinase [Actinoplanes palleronii]|uniref:histidine kinase n=1 Tax=Actinoplanes palleronii TaxID=113570 RepID=A0ABQ4BDL7_9ACTN|nr:HAMP domain-containing sensor histidine kinase [Actinoplanes palleronii]GIE68769.1 two-component sensor histidine kinase [Actinoplanes palleronii]
MRLRTRLTLLYGGLFALVSSFFLLVVEQLQLRVFDETVGDVPFVGATGSPPAFPPNRPRSMEKVQQDLSDAQRHLTLVAIAAVTVLAFVVCWWLTGRLLRPLARINAAARRLSVATLHERIALDGRQDELRELADTFDAMLDRLEQAVASQRRFIANASHELRTPLAIQRTAIEVGLDDPSPERLAEVRAAMLRNTERSERLITGLLELAQGERGLQAPGPVLLGDVVEQVVEEHRPAATAAGVTISSGITPVGVHGDEVLLTRLVANLVENAIRYNKTGGVVEVRWDAAGLLVGNTGPMVRPERVPELFEPFRRLHPDRTGRGEGAGLGLSIVAAIAHAHGATVDATANPDGGLTVRVVFTSPAPRSA